jgi:hypothetical protein
MQAAPAAAAAAAAACRVLQSRQQQRSSQQQGDRPQPTLALKVFVAVAVTRLTRNLVNT